MTTSFSEADVDFLSSHTNKRSAVRFSISTPRNLRFKQGQNRPHHAVELLLDILHVFVLHSDPVLDEIVCGFTDF